MSTIEQKSPVTPNLSPNELSDGAETNDPKKPNRRRLSLKSKLALGTAGALLIGGTTTVGLVAANSEHAPEDGVNVSETVFPHPDDPNYDNDLEISNSSDFTIYEVDQLTSYFNSGEISREQLIPILAKFNQEEVDKVREVIGNNDFFDNSEITLLLQKHGLDTSEMPYDPMGRISDNNNLVESDVKAVESIFFQGYDYAEIREAMQKFSIEEGDWIYKIVSGNAGTSGREVIELMIKHGFPHEFTYAD